MQRAATLHRLSLLFVTQRRRALAVKILIYLSQGQKRADALAHILKDSQITSVFVTEFKRTQETAAPTARAAHVSPTVLPANDIGALAEKLRALTGNALVVGHDSTIPDLLKALGIATPVSIPADDYTEIFAVLLGDAPQLLRLHYPF